MVCVTDLWWVWAMSGGPVGKPVVIDLHVSDVIFCHHFPLFLCVCCMCSMSDGCWAYCFNNRY